jgi:predicted ATPase/DNA-binding SARP family transcriptional activator/Tfp pilus assembly protein PilF
MGASTAIARDIVADIKNKMTKLLQIQLLGDFRLTYGDELLTTLNAERPQSLLAYLLLHRRAPQPRQHIAFLLWPDSSESQARSNLRNLLHGLRQTLPNAATFLLTDTLTLQWNPDAPFTLDVALFDAALAQAKCATDPAEVRHCLETAIEHYGGDLLPGNYDDWILALREELRRRQVDALYQLIGLLEEATEYRAALRYVQRLLHQDPLDEAAYVLQMRLCALSGDRTGIRRAYQSCVDVLARELAVEPSPATQAAYEGYLRLPPPASALATAVTPPPPPADVILPHTAAAGARPAERAPHTVARIPAVPTPRTKFLGRKRELAEVALRLADPHCRLLTVIGPGGVGKTRLALETAKGHQPIFADGVLFVPLAALESVDQIVTALTDALQLACQGIESPLDQLLDFLRDKELLLLLDNFEHLLDGAELIATLLDATTTLKLLVTSRERLNLQEEWIFELAGLPLAAEGETYGEENAAVALFLQSARRVRQEFTPSPADEAAIRRICQLVDGLPLGIELAATWVRLLSCAEILAEIERSLDFLTTTLRNLPERHRSLRAIFDQSWALMSAQEQAVFRRLTVFRGGFTRTAAAQIAGATLPVLSALVDKSLVQQIGNGRFSLHPVLRQYGEEHLAEAGETAEVRNRHLHYFVTYVEGPEPTYVRDPAWLAQVAAESENLWAALQWAATGGELEEGLRLAFSLHVYWEMRGYWREEYGWLTRLLALPTASPPTLFRVRLLTHAGKGALHLVDIATAIAYYNESLSLARALQSPPDIVMALISLGDSQQDAEAAHEFYTEGLTLSRAHDYPEGVARAVTCLGHLAFAVGDNRTATALYEEAMAIHQTSGDRLAANGVLRNLGNCAYAQRAHEQAAAIYQECLAIYQELGDKLGVLELTNDLGNVAASQGDFAQASQRYRQSLTDARELGSKLYIAWGLESLARVATHEQAYARAAYLFAGATQLFQTTAARLRQVDLIEHERLLTIVRTHLCDEAFLTHWQQGQSAPVEQAIAFALAG